MAKYFELTSETKVNEFGVTLHRIRCTRDTFWAKAGDLGGWVESESNLCDDAWVGDEAHVFGSARVYGSARVCGSAEIGGSADVATNGQHCGFDCFGSVNRHTHAYLTKSGGVEVACGCFRGSLDEFAQQVHATHAGTMYERQYMTMIDMIKLKFGLMS